MNGVDNILLGSYPELFFLLNYSDPIPSIIVVPPPAPEDNRFSSLHQYAKIINGISRVGYKNQFDYEEVALYPLPIPTSREQVIELNEEVSFFKVFGLGNKQTSIRARVGKGRCKFSHRFS